jgi:hexulose-6-phosphate isomerase
MKIGITQMVLPNMTLDEVLNFCQEAGYECLELFIHPGGELHPNLTDDEVAQVRRKCERAGIELASMVIVGEGIGSLLSPDPQQRELRKSIIARGCEIGEILGVDAQLLHPGQLEEAAQYDHAWGWLVDALKELAPKAAQHKVAIAVENVWNKFMLSPLEAKNLIEEVGSPYVSIYLDLANMVLYGYPQHWIRILGRKIKKVHFKDFRRADNAWVFLGEGDVNWQDCMKAFREVGYDGPVIHEVSGTVEDHKRTAQKMREIIAM